MAVLSTMLVSSSEARRLRTPTSVWMSTSSPRTCAAAQKDPMRLTGTALRLTVLVGESDRWHRRPLYTEIVHRAHQAGLAGATVLRGGRGVRRNQPDPHRPAAQPQRRPTRRHHHRRHPRPHQRVPAPTGGTGHRGPSDARRLPRHPIRRRRRPNPGSRAMNPALVVLGAAVGAPLRYHQPGSTTPSRHAVPMGHIHGQRDRVLHPGRGSRRGPRRRGLPAGPARARRRVLRTLTTYSTLSYDTLRLTEDGARFFAAANVVASIVAGLGAAFVGASISQALWS